MPLSPYLSFAGNCADAIAYYQQTLGAERKPLGRRIVDVRRQFAKRRERSHRCD